MLLGVAKLKFTWIEVTLPPTHDILEIVGFSCIFLQKFALLLQRFSPLKFVMKWDPLVSTTLKYVVNVPKKTKCCIEGTTFFKSPLLQFLVVHPLCWLLCNQSTKSTSTKAPSSQECRIQEYCSEEGEPNPSYSPSSPQHVPMNWNMILGRNSRICLPSSSVVCPSCLSSSFGWLKTKTQQLLYDMTRLKNVKLIWCWLNWKLKISKLCIQLY